MIINGLQKLTLLDFPGHVACTVFSAGCNFRCPFCHNASLVIGDGFENVIDTDEFFSFLKKRQGILDGVALTGGEPLLQHGIDEFCKRIKSLGYSVKLDTNGSFPDRLEALINDKCVDYVAMDIKNSREKYKLTVGADVDMTKIDRSVELLLSGNVAYEFRTTVVRELHTRDDMISIGGWIAGADAYFLQQYRDSGELINSDGLNPCTREEMENLAEAVRPFMKRVELRGIKD